MKKNILLLLVVAMLFSATSALAQGGTTGPLTWILEDGTLTINGEGAMPDYELFKSPWWNYHESIYTVIIETGVTSIGSYAFYYCTSMILVTIPNSVTSIEEGAFYVCSNLPSITIPNSVTNIGINAFANCYGLTFITIPNSVTTIGGGLFAYCTSLTAIDVEGGSNNYTSESGVLFDKDKTILICYPAGKTSTSYIIPNSVTTIENWAFASCISLTSITIPNSAITIGNQAFRACTSLISMTLPDGVTTIGEGAFNECYDLTSITIPESVTYIGSYAFYSCWSLTSITIPNGVTKIEDLTFHFCESLTSIIIPDGVTSIGEEAFSLCKSMTSVTIPSSVTSIGFAAFTYCSKLTSITNFNPVPVAIESWVFVGVNQGACKLKVPINAVPDYKKANVWKNFKIAGICSVNVSTNNEEYGTVAGDGIYEENTTATVTATANNGYKFINWKKDGIVISSENPYSFTVTENMELIANFIDENTQTSLITIDVNNEKYGTAIGGGIYEINTTAIVIATTNSGYRFVNWTIDGEEVSIENPYSFIVTEDVELVANFEENVGIVETHCNASLRVYPNPTSGELTIDGRDSINGVSTGIEIFDMMGKCVAPVETLRATSLQQPTSTINLSLLPSGIYFVRIQTDKEIITRKIIKN